MNLSMLKSDKKNLNSFITAGSTLTFIGFIDIILLAMFAGFMLSTNVVDWIR